jgi:hypothetical protein
MLKQELPGTNLFIVDDVAPEDLAMLQALYSRSADSVESHLEKVKRTGSARFCQQYFIGYNHKSIADCGTTTMFIEGISTLGAKAIQDWPLYSGQETSTRYIDMSKQRIVDPIGTKASKAILDRWMSFYTTYQVRVAETVRERYPITLEEKSDEKKAAAYEGAVKARTFDILRGFLPAGITTQLSWHTNLRQAGDHLNALAIHPTEEVSTIGLALQGMMAKQYPSSNAIGQAAVSAVVDDKEEKRRALQRLERATWEKKIAERYTYTSAMGSFPHSLRSVGDVVLRSTILLGELSHYSECLAARPRGCVLPHFMTDFGQLQFAFLLDFGSFRDIQRHRNGVCRMPLLTTELGFEPWYLDQLDDSLREEAEIMIDNQCARIRELSMSDVDQQYYTALGFRVACEVTYALPAAVYVMELRSNKTVHPTLRRIVHGMIGEFRIRMGDRVALHVDMDPDSWTVRRGMQTITEKR